MKQVKHRNKNTDGGGDKTLVNVEYASCSIMMGTPTKEWNYLLYPVIMFCLVSSQEVLQMYDNTYKYEEVCLKHNSMLTKCVW